MRVYVYVGRENRHRTIHSHTFSNSYIYAYAYNNHIYDKPCAAIEEVRTVQYESNS